MLLPSPIKTMCGISLIVFLLRLHLAQHQVWHPPLSCAVCDDGVFYLRPVPATTFRCAVPHWHPETRPTTNQAQGLLHHWRNATTENHIRHENVPAPASGTGVDRSAVPDVVATTRFLSSPHQHDAEWRVAHAA